MSDNILSESELNSLVDDASDAGFVTDVSAPLANEPKRYELGQQAKRPPGQLPGLEQINERFALGLKTALESLLRISPDLKISKPEHENLGSFLGKLSSPLSAVSCELSPLPGSGLIVIEPQLVYAMVDMLFGGSGHKSNPPGYHFSRTETSIAARLIDLVCQAYRLAWAPIAPLSLAIQATFSQTKFVDFEAPSAMLVVTRIAINLGEISGELLVSLPYESLLSVLEPLGCATKLESANSNTDWFNKMSDQLGATKLELVVNLTEIETTVQGLLALQVGQVLDCDIKPCLTAQVEGTPFLTGHYGLHQGRYALRVQKFLVRQSALSDLVHP